jgi:serine/threonine-protein kinase
LSGDARGFVPGQVLAERYRMVGLLGRGGMGEVYRADDLKLGQTVALKFLPRDVEHDKDRLERFLTEVRLSLKVTHPNVCRVHDIADADGRHFISMEYVDGEDLASLLRRIGRLPEDKAVEIARQLCAGLAAAHDEGVLHRDLKPANVMIDGRGRAKITDFGLAGATAGVIGREAQAGTPQYMAPEQFDGRELTVQTDLYSLGLVLYELFTGKRAFDSRDLGELQKMRSSSPTNPGALVSGLSPVVERAILRCLDPEPGRRPTSAESLAAALPGGDPLAMAVAAGETPSPEMVARSGGVGELRPAVAIGCLAAVLFTLGVVWYTEVGRAGLQNWVPLPKPPAELRILARAALASAGYTSPPVSTADGFTRDAGYFTHIERTNQSVDRWNALPSVTPSPVSFWHREAPFAMNPFNNVGAITSGSPPLTSVGMMRVRLDPSGRLQELSVVPPDVPESPGPWTEPDWTPLFAAAGLTQGEWTPTPSTWAAPHDTDVRRAWKKDTVLLEAASFRGRPVWFRVIPDWRQPAEVARAAGANRGAEIATYIVNAVIILVIAGAGLIARRHIRTGRSDRRGAFRMAAVYVCAGIGNVLMWQEASPDQWFAVLQNNVAWQLYLGMLIWLFYLAVEPYVRRFWPGTLVAWSRVIEGRWRDPLVGRHILLGALLGFGFTLLFMVPTVAASVIGVAPTAPVHPPLEMLGSDRSLVGGFFGVLQGSFFVPVSMLIVVLVMRVICRRPWIAYAAMYIIVAVVFAFNDAPWMMGVTQLLVLTLSLIVLTRLGLFAFVVAVFFSYWGGLPLTADPNSWFFTRSAATMAVFAAIAVYGFWVSLGDQKVFKQSVLDV